jgi:hypothetical protein
MGQARAKRIHRERRLEGRDECVKRLLELPGERIKALEVEVSERDLDVGDCVVKLGRYRRVWVIDRLHRVEWGVAVECVTFSHDGRAGTGMIWQIQSGLTVRVIPFAAVGAVAVVGLEGARVAPFERSLVSEAGSGLGRAGG